MSKRKRGTLLIMISTQGIMNNNKEERSLSIYVEFQKSIGSVDILYKREEIVEFPRRDNKVRSKKKVVRYFIIGGVCTNKKNRIMRKILSADHFLPFLLVAASPLPSDFRAFFVGDEVVLLRPEGFFFEAFDCC